MIIFAAFVYSAEPGVHGTRSHRLLLIGPVEHLVVDQAAFLEQAGEQTAQVVVVWRFEEVQRARVVHVDGELLRESTAQFFYCGRAFRFSDLLVAFLERVPFQALPG